MKQTADPWYIRALVRTLITCKTNKINMLRSLWCGHNIIFRETHTACHVKKDCIKIHVKNSCKMLQSWFQNLLFVVINVESNQHVEIILQLYYLIIETFFMSSHFDCNTYHSYDFFCCCFFFSWIIINALFVWNYIFILSYQVHWSPFLNCLPKSLTIDDDTSKVQESK